MELPPLNIHISFKSPEERSFRSLPYFVQCSLIERAKKLGVDPIDLHRCEQPVLDTYYFPELSYSLHLENCTDAVQSTPEEETSMAYKRVHLPVGLDKNGNPIDRQIGGKSEAERFIHGLQAAIQSGRIKEFSPAEYFQQFVPPLMYRLNRIRIFIHSPPILMISTVAIKDI